MQQKHSNQQYATWLQQLNKTNSVVSCMLVDGSHGKVVAHAGLNLDKRLTGLINKFYAGVSLDNAGEQLITSDQYYHLTRILDKQGRLFIHVVVKKKKAYLPLVRLKISNIIMSFSFSGMMARKIPKVQPLSYSQSV